MTAVGSAGQPRQIAGRCEPATGPAVDGTKAGTVMAFDFGTRRIGVAVGETQLRIAHALETIAFEDNRRRFEAIDRLVEEWRPVRLVLGCPGAGASGEHPLAPAVARFARRLRARYSLPLELVDEHLSSWAGSHRLSEAGVAAHAQKHRLDAMAACIILETWFERQQARGAQEHEGQGA